MPFIRPDRPVLKPGSPAAVLVGRWGMGLSLVAGAVLVVNHKSRLESCPSTEGKIRQASRNLNEASENIYQKGRSTCDHFRVAAEP